MKRISRPPRRKARTVDHHERQIEELRENPELARGFLEDAIRELLEGDEKTALILLRDVIAAIGGFPALAQDVHLHPKALHRMLSDRGNPTTASLMAILKALCKRLEVKPAEQLLVAA